MGVLLSHLIPTRMEAPTSISRRAARRPLILVFIAAAMPLALFAGWVVFLNAQQQRRGSQAAAVETLDSVVNRLASEISLQLEIAETVAASATLDKPDLDAFYREATRVNEARPLWQTIQLVDPDGNQVLDVSRPLGDGMRATADRENFEQILKTRKPAIGGIGPRGPITGKRVVAVRAPVERDGQLKFVLTVALVPDAISQILKSAGAPAGWVGFVVDAKGNIVARTFGEQSELGQSASATVRQAIASAPEGSYVKTTPAGEQVELDLQSHPRNQRMVGPFRNTDAGTEWSRPALSHFPCRGWGIELRLGSDFGLVHHTRHFASPARARGAGSIGTQRK